MMVRMPTIKIEHWSIFLGMFLRCGKWSLRVYKNEYFYMFNFGGKCSTTTTIARFDRGSAQSEGKAELKSKIILHSYKSPSSSYAEIEAKINLYSFIKIASFFFWSHAITKIALRKNQKSIWENRPLPLEKVEVICSTKA